MPTADLSVAATFATAIDAEMAQGALKAAGIESIVSADNAGGQYPGISGESVRLLVRPDDLHEAKAILRTPAASMDSPSTN